MIKKRIKEIRDYVFAENENFTLEHRIFLSTIIYGILVCMIGSIVAILYMSSNISVIISLLICGICCMTYYFVRFKRIITPFIMPLIVISFIGISVVWILGGGIEGSIILTFILALILAIIIAPDKFKKYVITLFLLLVIIIYAIQFFRPDLIIHFSSENKRWITSLIIITYTSLTIYLIIRFLISQYTLEKLRHGESEYNLKERIKELNGIYSLGQIAEKVNNLEEIFNEFVNNIVPQSMQFPEKTFVSFEIEDKRYCNSENFILSKIQKYLFAPIYLFGEKSGELIVAYTEELAFVDFFEQQLITNFAEHISKITERIKTGQTLKENQYRLEQLNVDKDRFISILGHDLKNPFNSLLGLSEVLTEDISKLDLDEIETLASQIHTTAHKINSLLEDILKWAGAQQGKIPFKPQISSTREICMDIIDFLSPNANAKNITINYSAPDQINIFADIDMIKTVLRNLVSNAIKFTNSSGIININAEQNSKNVTIAVSDNGIGIEPDELKKLFDISEVLTTKGTAGETGTGLGLLLCKEFVVKHGGKIWVESELGKGSTFYFTIPNDDEPNGINVIENIVSG